MPPLKYKHSFLSDFFVEFNNQDQSIRRNTRGQATHLLHVPFIRGSAGQSLIQFMGSIYWNMLPADIRSLDGTVNLRLHLRRDHIDVLSVNN